MFDSSANLVNMRQQSNDSNNGYKERFDSNIHTVEMAKAIHIFCSNDLLKYVDDDLPTAEEI